MSGCSFCTCPLPPLWTSGKYNIYYFLLILFFPLMYQCDFAWWVLLIGLPWKPPHTQLKCHVAPPLYNHLPHAYLLAHLDLPPPPQKKKNFQGTFQPKTGAYSSGLVLTCIYTLKLCKVHVTTSLLFVVKQMVSRTQA